MASNTRKLRNRDDWPTPAAVFRDTFADLTRPLLLQQMAWVIVFWLVVMVNLIVNIDYLRTNYPDPPRPPDLLLEQIPESTLFITVAEVLSASMLVVVALIFWRRHFVGLPHLLFLVGLMFWIRGYVILLTPLAQIQPPSLNYDESHVIAQTFYHGMFFSGHTASAFIQAFYFRRHRLYPLLLLLAIGQAFALIASHSHYTIDVVGGFFVAYFVVSFDWMQLVPRRLLRVKWLPWIAGRRLRRRVARAYTTKHA